MPRVVFTSNLRRHIDAPPAQVGGKTVREVLEEVFTENPRLRGYVLDDQDRVRHHVVLFVDGNRADLTDPVNASSEVYVLQALSGGKESVEKLVSVAPAGTCEQIKTRGGGDADVHR